MPLISALVISMFVSVYVPSAGGINGCLCNTASGKMVETGFAACGQSYKFGTVFELPSEIGGYGLPTLVVCEDRGSAVFNQNLDIALVGDNSTEDLKTAYSWGIRLTEVRVYRSMREYESIQKWNNKHETN